MTNENLAREILSIVDEGSSTYEELVITITNLLNEEL